jgi:hypothetical protein
MMPIITSQTLIWDPIAWLIAAVLILLIVYIIRSVGDKRYEKGTAQAKPFWSGNIKEPEGTAGSTDLYWGFMDSFSALWKPLMRMHTGIANDYLGAFVVVLAVVLVVILLL